MSIAVVYYTRGKTTRVAARNIAERCEGELIELKEVTPTKGFLRAARKAMKGFKAPLVDHPEEKIKEASTIFIGSPIWASSVTPAIHEFLNIANLKDKNIIFFTVQAGKSLSGMDKLYKDLKETVEAKEGKYLDAFGLTSSVPKNVNLNDYFDLQLEKWTIFQEKGDINLI